MADSLIEIERVRSAVNRSMNSGVSSASKSWKVWAVLWLESRKDEGDRVEEGAVVSIGDDDRVDEDDAESEVPEAEARAMHNSVVECGSFWLCWLCWLCCCSGVSRLW